MCISTDFADGSSQLHELLTGRNSHAVAFHQYPEGVGCFHFLFEDVSAVRICIGLCVWLPVVLALALSVERHLFDYLGGIRPFSDVSSGSGDGFGRSCRVHGLAGRSLSFLLPPALVLKGSFGLSPKGKMLRTVLVCFQFFVSFMLIISVGIMYLQSRYIQRSDYGYDKEVVLVGEIPNEYLNRREAIVSELSGISGIEGISISQFVLSSSDNYMSWGRGSGERAINMVCFPVDYRYLSVMGIKITEGRDFKPGDGDVYIFNEAARKKYPWMRVDEPAVPEDYPVIGFCENIRFSSFRNNDAVEPMAFFIYGKDYADWDANSILNIRVASGVDKVDMLHRLTEAAEKIAPGRDFKFRFMDEVIDQNYHRELRFTRQILLFSLIAIVLSMIGVFGLTLFESEYRRKEIGIRKILGSSTGEILYMFTKRYFVMLVVCFVLAAPGG